jgi:hypothetical protein
LEKQKHNINEMLKTKENKKTIRQTIETPPPAQRRLRDEELDSQFGTTSRKTGQ